MVHVSHIRSELRYLVRELGLLDKNCLNSNLSLSQAHILTYLDRNGDTPFAELCVQLNVEKASLSRTLTTLDSKNYLSSQKHPQDKRQKMLSLLHQGKKALEQANLVANREFSEILDGIDDQEMDTMLRGLRLLRTRAFRRNLAHGKARIQTERLAPSYQDEVLALLTDVFTGEQGIPTERIPLPDGSPVHWWCARAGEYIVGAVACWKVNDKWHWGRFAVDPHFRGLGIGKQLARHSLNDLFENITDTLESGARDTTVAILKGFGAKVSGEPEIFYGMPITPMVLKKKDYLITLKKSTLPHGLT